MEQLRCLYLSKNMITRIDGLQNLKVLTTLDLSNNRLTIIENLSCCPMLQTINLSKNALSKLENISHLQECLALHTIDLMDNQLDGDILPYLINIPALVSVALNGNPTTRTASFRKKLIAAMPRLCYLDRPVEEQERLGAVAFVEGGAEAEAAVRERYREDQKTKRIQEMETFRNWQKEQQKARAEAIAQGLSRGGITEFTAEEIRHRQIEADEAARAEKELVGLGIGKVGAKYWAIEGQHGEGGYNFDALDRAVSEIKAENTRIESAASDTVDVEEVKIELNTADISEGNNETSKINAISSPSKQVSASDILSSAINSEKSLPVEPPDLSSAISDKFEDFSVDDDSAPEDHNADPISSSETDAEFVGLSEQQQQNIREQRVADSLAIYYRQRETEKQKASGHQSGMLIAGANHAQLSPNNTISQTWTTSNQSKESANLSVKETNTARPLYWSETMDLKLAELVRKHVFKFDKISDEMKGLAEDGALGGDANLRKEKITVDSCRLRWTQLDARQWAELDEKSKNAAETGFSALPVYKVHVQVDSLGKGHGSQPSFSALTSMAKGAAPSYLTPPSTFPSVADYGNDSEEDDEEGSRKALTGLD